MRVAVTTEVRFLRTPDGAVWTRIPPAYPSWTCYLSAFDTVRVVARVADIAAPDDKAVRVDGPGVQVWPVPYYVGPRQYLLRRAQIRRSVIDAVTDADAVILRVPSPIGTLLASALERQGRPYAVEVVGDPYDLLAPGVLRHPLRPVLRNRITANLRRQCRDAIAAAYVTERALQDRYPAGPMAPSVGVSDVSLDEAAYAPHPRTVDQLGAPNRLVSVGSLEQMHKGIDTLIEALAILRRSGLSLRLVHVGTGQCRPRLEQLALRRGVFDLVTFAGWLPPGDAVRQQFDAADLFVMPTRTEGLPRAMVEAMARGLPAIGSPVGGIPELLPAEHLVAPGEPVRLAETIRRLITDPERMAAASARNLVRARAFSAEALTQRRADYYRLVADATQQRTPASTAS
ncbi:glycosyltransferase family 4 protein [Micromonospora sp. NPDC003197]